MLNGRSAGDEEDIWCTLEKPRKRYLHWRSSHGGGCLVKAGGLQGGESAQGEERNVCNTQTSELSDEGVVCTMNHIIVILHANDFRDRPSLSKLHGTYVTQADMANQALQLEFGQDG